MVDLATAVPLTSILATSVFLFYIVFLKIILKPTPNISWRDARWGYWSWVSWFRFIIGYTICWAFITIFFIVFVASLYNPAMLGHDLFYDIFLFRTNNDSLAAAHALDYLLIPSLFFFCIIYWGRKKILEFIFVPFSTRENILSLENKEYIFKAGLMVAFMVFFHEAIWFFFYYIKYWRVELDTLSDVVIGDLTFLVMIFTFFLATRMRYKEEFTRRLFYGAIILGVYDFCWFLDGMKVTTIPKIIDGIPSATITQWYYDPITSMWEVGGWVLAFSIMVTVIILNHRSLIKKLQLEAIPKVA